MKPLILGHECECAGHHTRRPGGVSGKHAWLEERPASKPKRLRVDQVSDRRSTSFMPLLLLYVWRLHVIIIASHVNLPASRLPLSASVRSTVGHRTPWTELVVLIHQCPLLLLLLLLLELLRLLLLAILLLLCAAAVQC